MELSLKYIFFIVAGYLSGGILFGYYIPKLIKNVDVYIESEDGNPGTYNAFVCGGFWCGVITLIGDLSKGFIPVFLCHRVLGGQYLLYSLVIAAPAIGHAFPLSGNGGKSIAVSFGVLIGVLPNALPLILLIVCYLAFSLIIQIKEHNTRSVITFASFAILTLFFVKDEYIKLGCLMISGIVMTKIISSKNRLKEDKIVNNV